MPNKYVCIHGHFYQPPRESPWLEEIETQESAAPYHDWNERITEECYWPNTHARIINQGGDSERIVNNFEKISFNFGPTLLSWMKRKYPQVLQAIVEADANSCARFNSHGNAMAQAYNHMIMPLANSLDKFTEIYWAIRDFEYYFKRKPEGLWLPETAVDLESLDMMQRLGIKFTILSPHQAKRTRALGGDVWSEQLTSGVPYRLQLPSGGSLVIFFYDGDLAHAVAFEKLLVDGGHFARRLMHESAENYTDHRLMHIATDGETYGHHHAFGDMSLAYAIQCLENSGEVTLTNYANFIEIQPPEFEVEIHQNSSWSCEHGIERWRNNCGCNGGSSWHQAWRAPLREALDWLRDQLIPVYAEQMSRYVKDPWAARNQYIQVINDRDLFNQFIQEQALRPLLQAEKMQVLKWSELQRYALLMYTSCGWFFDELSGLETVQILRYAGRVIELAEQLTQNNYEEGFLIRLAVTPSNLAEFGNGVTIYQRFVKPNFMRKS